MRRGKNGSEQGFDAVDRSDRLGFEKDRMNLSGTVNALRLLYAPRQFMPGVSVATFAQLPVPIPPRKDGGEIKVVVLDKDNCFAVPHENRVFPDYMVSFCHWLLLVNDLLL